MNINKVLQDTGLSENEATIYTALLTLGPSLVSQIVKETHINRTHIYDRLYKLIQKGVVSYTIQSGKKYFHAISPDKLLAKIKEKEAHFRAILPHLSHLGKQKKHVDIEVYQGKNGLKSVLQDYLAARKDILIFGFTGTVAKKLQFYYSHFQRKRIKLGIKRKILADSTLKDSPLLQEPLTHTRFIPAAYQSPSGMWVYGDTTVLFLPEDELYMVVIKSKKMAQLYTNYFTLLWNIAKP